MQIIYWIVDLIKLIFTTICVKQETDQGLICYKFSSEDQSGMISYFIDVEFDGGGREDLKIPHTQWDWVDEGEFYLMRISSRRFSNGTKEAVVLKHLTVA